MFRLVNPATNEAVCRDVFRSFNAAKRASLHLAKLGINHVIRPV
jgi:hypothetical protein